MLDCQIQHSALHKLMLVVPRTQQFRVLSDHLCNCRRNDCGAGEFQPTPRKITSMTLNLIINMAHVQHEGHNSLGYGSVDMIDSGNPLHLIDRKRLNFRLTNRFNHAWRSDVNHGFIGMKCIAHLFGNTKTVVAGLVVITWLD